MANNEWDVIVIGARVAGCAAAIRFADSGYRVLVVEKGREGSDTLSTHGFGGENPMDQLNKLGVLDEVIAAGAPPLDVFRLDWEGGTVSMPISNEWGYTLCVRRTTLDPILVKRARTAGAEVRFDTELVDLVRDDERVVGVIVATPDGDAEQHRARLIIGADGRHSKMADLVGAGPYGEVISPTSAFYAYFENVGLIDGKQAFQFASGGGADSILCGCDGGLACILLIVSNDDFEAGRPNAANYFDARIKEIPGNCSADKGRAPRIEGETVRPARG